MRIQSIGRWCKLALFLTLSVLALTVAAQQTSSLVVGGMQGQAKVIQVQGRNYVDVDGLVRLTRGASSFSGNQIVLTLPGYGTNAPAQAAVPAVAQATPQAPSSPPGFSKGFVYVGVRCPLAELFIGCPLEDLRQGRAPGIPALYYRLHRDSPFTRSGVFIIQHPR
ncbi:MAG: hypothetical protein WBQ89_10095 [Candidatus Acidiferrum sp.]